VSAAEASLPLLEARQLTKRYGDVVALDRLDLSVARGEVFCLLGHNGAGKTTTINLFLGFESPSSGVALIKGLDVTSHTRETKRALAYIPEQVTLYRNLSAIENLRFFSALAGHREYSERALTDLLIESGLASADVNRRIGTYSKGMRQKVAIAIALAKRAEVLLLDEPTSGLDPTAANEFSRVLANLVARGAAVLMTTHDLLRAKLSGTRIGILRRGQLVTVFDAASIGYGELEDAYLRHVAEP
jgi:ABC-2 type transport system ATP-binding protein